MTFAIYELAVGGGTLALSPIPADVATVTGWRPDAVLTMTQAGEMPQSVADGLGAAALEWITFPVVDYGVPDALREWGVVADRVVTILAQGGRVLVHCKGGCGRSGMAVLRIMIAAGEPADAALKRLRAVRPCAVETEAQLAWATGASLP